MKQHRILMTLIILSSFWTSTSYAEATSADSIRNAMPELTIYHLEGRRSERLVWLMEELNLPYNLVLARQLSRFNGENQSR